MYVGQSQDVVIKYNDDDDTAIPSNKQGTYHITCVITYHTWAWYKTHVRFAKFGTAGNHLFKLQYFVVMYCIAESSYLKRKVYNIRDLCEDTDEKQIERIKRDRCKVGALWHIYHPNDIDKIRHFINKVLNENGQSLPPDHDPIHDQAMYLDSGMRKRLYQVNLVLFVHSYIICTLLCYLHTPHTPPPLLPTHPHYSPHM